MDSRQLLEAAGRALDERRPRPEWQAERERNEFDQNMRRAGGILATHEDPAQNKRSLTEPDQAYALHEQATKLIEVGHYPKTGELLYGRLNTYEHHNTNAGLGYPDQLVSSGVLIQFYVMHDKQLVHVGESRHDRTYLPVDHISGNEPEDDVSTSLGLLETALGIVE